jgi:hypothetical protein
MSEYQRYEFQAIDRPLAEREMQALRACSSRATITATRFVNEYHWGDFKGSVSQWMEKYFDAFVYVANWRTREFMLRLPRRLLPLDVAKSYLRDEWHSVRAKGEHVVITLLVEEEDSDWDGTDDGSGWLASLIPLRADIAAGDLRALYLAWLRSVQNESTNVEMFEPPVPPGLADLTAPLQALVDFLGIDGNLLAAAAAGSPVLGGSASDVRRWIEAMPESEKTDFLVRIAEGQEPFPRAELLRRHRSEGEPVRTSVTPRRVGQLLSTAEAHRDERRRREAERAAKERVRREREAAAARERRLDELAAKEPAAWRNVASLIATKQPGMYDDAVKLLIDLRDVSVRSDRAAEFDARVRRLADEHVRKVTFVDRLRRAGLATTIAPLFDAAVVVESPRDGARRGGAP